LIRNRRTPRHARCSGAAAAPPQRERRGIKRISTNRGSRSGDVPVRPVEDNEIELDIRPEELVTRAARIGSAALILVIGLWFAFYISKLVRNKALVHPRIDATLSAFLSILIGAGFFSVWGTAQRG
jgi:hypothetical protein